MSAGPRSIPTLHTQRPVDNYQPFVRIAHIVSPAQAAQGPDQGERRGRQGGRPGDHFGQRDRKQLLGPAVPIQGEY